MVYATKWIGAWTPKMTQAGFRVDPATRRLEPSQAVKFVQTVMRPGFMSDSYTPKVLAPEQNARMRDEVAALAKNGADFSANAGQRAFDMASSFDLRAMVNGYYSESALNNLGSIEDITDPTMKAFNGMPCVAVIGARSFPKFRLTAIPNSDKLVYTAPGFMKGSIETTPEDSYVDRDGVSYISNPSKGEKEIDQRHAFNRIFAEHGLFGYHIEMEGFDPLTALGGMGMSNHVALWSVAWASMLSGAQKDWGQIFAEGGNIENTRLNGLTGFQEAIQAVLPGNGILIYAHDYYGGIGRQLMGPEYAKQIEDNMWLILYNRITGDKRLPVNETWTVQAAAPTFHDHYQRILEVAWDGEVAPMLQASATGAPIDLAKLRAGYSEHSKLRWQACQQYWGNDGEQKFIREQLANGNAVFPLGEGSNNSTKLLILGGDAPELPVLTREDAENALNVAGTVTTGRVPFKFLDKGLELGNGWGQLNGGNNIPEELITIAG